MATFAENIFLMITREEVAEVITYCKKNNISYKTRLAELGIQAWMFYDSKSFLACALGNKACRLGYKVVYYTMQKLMDVIRVARIEGKDQKLLGRLNKMDVLIIDDFGMKPIDGQQQNDFEQILDDRYKRKALIISSQLPISDWHALFRNRSSPQMPASGQSRLRQSTGGTRPKTMRKMLAPLHNVACSQRTSIPERPAQIAWPCSLRHCHCSTLRYLPLLLCSS